MNNLTDRQFWQRYWENYQYEKVPERSNFDSYFPEKMQNGKGKTAIEIGGFPGTMSLFFNRRFGYSPSLLDFYIDSEIIHKMESTNGFQADTVKCIESDFFAFTPEEKYDLVFSIGFIEHFDDTADVLKRHADLLAHEGVLFIALPNFLGINGLVQRIFDNKNFKVHNLNSMKLDNLDRITRGLNLKDVKIEYTRKPMIWLEPKPTTGNKIARKIVKLMSYFLKLFPIKSRLLSPYIVITAVRAD